MLFGPNQNNAQPAMGSVHPDLFDDRAPAKYAGIIPAWGWQFFRFSLVGVLNTMVDAGVYFLLSRSILMSQVILAKGLSYSVGILNSFYWNKSWTFQSRVKSRKVFLPFTAANLLAVGLNTWMMHIALDKFSLPELSALILATAVTFVWNFIVNKLLIFR